MLMTKMLRLWLTRIQLRIDGYTRNKIVERTFDANIGSALPLRELP